MNPQDTHAQNPPAQGQATPNRPPRTRDNEAQTLGKPWGCSSQTAPHPREPSHRQTGLRDTQNLHGLCLAVWRSALLEECRTQNQQA
ncbi:hypothetical protein [Methylovulum psychrotolerans]|nr:hypothetical protein [Methylovulum psychrotolerans]